MKFSLLVAITLLAILFSNNNVSAAATSFYFKDFQLNDSLIYGADFSNNRLQIVDATYPSSLTLRATVDFNYSPFRVVSNGNYAYVLLTSNSDQSGSAIDATYYYAYLNVVDITNSYYPAIVYTTSVIYNAHSLAVSGNFLFLSSDYLYVYNISKPTAPILILTISSSKGEMAAKYIDSNSAYLLLVDKYSLYSYYIYKSGSVTYKSSRIDNYARDVFIFGSTIFAVSDYTIYEYTFGSGATPNLISTYTRNYILSNTANSIIYDNTSGRQYINFKYSPTIVSYDVETNNALCTYYSSYQTDFMAFSGNYFFATQTNRLPFLVINTSYIYCDNTIYLSIEAIIGIALGTFFFMSIVCCITCVSVRHYRRIKLVSYKPLVNPSTIQPGYPPQPGYSPQSGYPPLYSQGYPQQQAYISQSGYPPQSGYPGYQSQHYMPNPQAQPPPYKV
jgi:hypothetical protein